MVKCIMQESKEENKMENYGLTVRQIRLSKGFSLKEIYTGILFYLLSVEKIRKWWQTLMANIRFMEAAV